MSVNWTDTSGKPITELPEDCFGFVYKITYKDNTFYYGKKQVQFKKKLPMLQNGKRRPNSLILNKKVKLTKEELAARPPSNKSTNKIVQFEEVVLIPPSWKKYSGSSKDTPPVNEIASKRILFLASNKRTLTYLETFVLFKTHAVCQSRCHNSNILGKFFDNSLQGWIKDWR